MAQIEKNRTTFMNWYMHTDELGNASLERCTPYEGRNIERSASPANGDSEVDKASVVARVLTRLRYLSRP